VKKKTTGIITILVVYLVCAVLSAGNVVADKPADTPSEDEKPVWMKKFKGSKMVKVPAGKFMMGCDKGKGSKCGGNEKPYHEVYLDEFYIDKYETTNREYQQCADEGECSYNKTHLKLRDHKQPILNIDWKQAHLFCQWAGKRLPTEAEWEKAARGTDGRIYPWGNDKVDCKKAHYKKCKPKKTLTIGSLPDGASPYGAMDMAGNAQEWTADWYKRSYYARGPKKNPKGPTSGSFHLVRGGSWEDKPQDLRTSRRVRVVFSETEWNNYGVRCAATPPE